MRRALVVAATAVSVLWSLQGAGCRHNATRSEKSSATDHAAPPTGMVRIPAGRFLMGTDRGLPFEGPAHEVSVAGLWIDSREVINAEFARFVEATGYVTESEKWGWAGVFNQKSGEWERVDGASWRHPEGPGSDISNRMDCPAVQVSWHDASAYAEWAGKRLPTEAEWEWAARGGLESKAYGWGDELRPAGKFMANYWQGNWPVGNTGQDGYSGVAPVGSFPANGYGLYDMAGNVWEWTADWFAYYAYADAKGLKATGPPSGEERVIRGGSFLCNQDFCSGYRVAARNKNTPDSATNNLGFRCARDE